MKLFRKKETGFYSKGKDRYTVTVGGIAKTPLKLKEGRYTFTAEPATITGTKRKTGGTDIYFHPTGKPENKTLVYRDIEGGVRAGELVEASVTKKGTTFSRDFFRTPDGKLSISITREPGHFERLMNAVRNATPSKNPFMGILSGRKKPVD